MTIKTFKTDCPDCDGEGRVTEQDRGTIEMGPGFRDHECPRCDGTGKVTDTMKCQRCGEDLLVSDGDNLYCSVCREECPREEATDVGC